MKILVVHNDYQSRQIGGEDIVVNREVAGLKAALGDAAVMEYRVSNDTIKIGRLVRSLWGDRDHAKAIQTLIRDHQIDIVHVHNFFPLLTARVFEAAKATGALVVHTLHNFRWWCSAGTLYRQDKGQCRDCLTKTWGYPAILHACYRSSRLQSAAASLAFFWYRHKQYADCIDAYFVLTAVQKNLLAECGLNDKLWLKPNPINPPNTIRPAAHKKDYLYVGRCEPSKGLYLLLQIRKTLPKHYILRVVGDGEAREDYERLFGAENIRFYGNLPQDQVLDKMAASRFTIHPGLAVETFGLTVIESLAQGTPVIALAIGTRLELIAHDQNGFLCNEAELRQTILDSAFMDNYEQMQQRASESAKQFYLESVINRQIQLYQSLLLERQ